MDLQDQIKCISHTCETYGYVGPQIGKQTLSSINCGTPVIHQLSVVRIQNNIITIENT